MRIIPLFLREIQLVGSRIPGGKRELTPSHKSALGTGRILCPLQAAVNFDSQSWGRRCHDEKQLYRRRDDCEFHRNRAVFVVDLTLLWLRRCFVSSFWPLVSVRMETMVAPFHSPTRNSSISQNLRDVLLLRESSISVRIAGMTCHAPRAVFTMMCTRTIIVFFSRGTSQNYLILPTDLEVHIVLAAL